MSSVFSIHPVRILFSALAVCDCCFQTSVARCKLINISSVNSASIFNRTLFPPGWTQQTLFYQISSAQPWFAVFVSDRMHNFRMLIRRLMRLIWWLTLLLRVCDFWDHFCNFWIHVFNTISDFCVDNVAFINSVRGVHCQQRREKTCYYQNRGKEWCAKFEWGAGCLFSLLVHRDVLCKNPRLLKVRSYQQH